MPQNHHSLFPVPVLPTGLLRIAALLLALTMAGTAAGAEDCVAGTDLILTNGNILTMDAAGSTARSIRIRGERIVSLDAPVNRNEACVEVVDLDGRTVIPGLIDSHTHFVRTAQAPGPFITGLEAATSIAELQAALREAATRADAGEWLASIGGYTPEQFVEKRIPTRAELSEAVPDHPVYLQLGYRGRAVVNDAGAAIMAGLGVDVSDEGIVPTGGLPLTTVLRSPTESQMRERFAEYTDYANSKGLTTVVDHACCPWLGAELADDEQVGLRIAESLWHADELNLRLRIQYDHRDVRDQGDIRSATARIANTTRGLGDGMYKVVRFGEQIIAASATDDEVLTVFRRLAAAGWPLSQHAIAYDEIERYVRLMEQVAKEHPLQGLRWSLEHVFEITPDQIARLNAIGVGVRVQDHDYIRNESSTWRAGPPYRSLLQSGMMLGAGTDSGVVGALNPWLNIYYMVTGKDAGGNLLLPGEAISRLDALRLYTANNAWYNFEEDLMGSLEAGKLADLVVLDRPFLAVSDEDIKHITSLLTLVGGRPVFAAGPFAELEQAD